MKDTLTKGRLYKVSAWVAIGILTLGGFGYGYFIATVQSRAARSIEISINQKAYQSSLDSKDRLIAALAKTTIVATGQAADAVATAAASDASGDSKAAAVVGEKTKATLQQNTKPINGARVKERTK